ncbi:MAG: KH domain-containing protein [Candidatus Margulisbacteria bacterium]|nr:KH domain-containing protein [Candidatus Margulisiibacteriota bacterium]
MRELVEYIAKALVDRPDQVSVKETAGESITIIEIRTAPEDAGKVIGKEGRIANSIRTIVKAAAAKQNKKVTVEILTDDGPRPSTV